MSSEEKSESGSEWTPERLETIDFSCFDVNREQIFAIITAVFEREGFFEPPYSIPRKKFPRFLREVESGYQNNPYHCFRHGFDVFQAALFFLHGGGADQWLTHIDGLVLLLGALTHDLRHPGLDNNFQIRTESELALTYNDKSPLENLHASSLFRILRREECSLLENMSPQLKKQVRAGIVEAIMATDMSQHGAHIAAFRQTCEKHGIGQYSESKQQDSDSSQQTVVNTESEHQGGQKYGAQIADAADRQRLLNMLIKMSDISNVVRPFHVAHRWTCQLCQEFFIQGDIEAKLGLSVAPHQNRKINHGKEHKIVLGFIQFVARAAFETFVNAFDSQFSRSLLGNMNANEAQWKGMGEKNSIALHEVIEKGAAVLNGEPTAMSTS